MNKPRPIRVLLLPTALYPRPESLPEGWELYNAPRPLYASARHGVPRANVEWTGEFLHGVFYAGIDPTDEYADTWRQRNGDLDAWKLEHISMGEARGRMFAYYMARWGVNERWPESRIRDMVDKGTNKGITQTLWNLLEEQWKAAEAARWAAEEASRG